MSNLNIADYYQGSYLHNFLDHAKGKECFLFGASVAGFSAPDYLKKHDITPKCYIDNDKKKWGSQVQGLTVYSPDQLKEESEPLILITSDSVTAIRNKLKSLGYNKNIYNLPGLGCAGSIHELFDGNVIHDNQDKLVELESILADNQSWSVLQGVIKSRLTGDFTYFDNIFETGLFFPKGIVTLSNQEIFVDAGAYDGDTVLNFYEKTDGCFNSIYSFEPDAGNFEKLQDTVNTLSNRQNIHCIQKGVFNKNGQISFSGKNIESKIDCSGLESIQIVALDDYLNKQSPTFLKIHVQGAELSALEGAKKMILAKKPKLAVILNQKPKDLWEIPLTIKSWVTDYKIYLRHHSTSCVNTVCYAV
jgi:FkbM family methyltransferase